MNLEVNHLSYTINQKYLLKDISFKITDNEFLSIVSSDKAQEEALISIILGTTTLKSGTIRVDERDIVSLRPFERGISVITMSPSLKANFTVYDNIVLRLRNSGMKEEEIEKAGDNMIDALHLETIKAEVPAVISYYQELVTSLGRAAVSHPKILLLLDPLSLLSLDKQTEFMRLIKDARDLLNHPLVIYFGKVTPLTSRIITIDKDGKLMDDGRLEVVENYPSCKESLSLLSLPQDEKYFDEKGFSTINNHDILIPATFDSNTLFYEDNHLFLNDIFKRQMIKKNEVAFIKINPSRFTLEDKGGFLPFKINKIIPLKEGIINLIGNNFSLVKKDTKEFYEGMNIYYPRDFLVLLSKEKNRINTLYFVQQNHLKMRVLNQFKGLLKIGSSVVESSLKLKKNLTDIILSNTNVYHVSSSLDNSLFMKRIIDVEEFEDFYLVNGFIDGSNNLSTIKLSKEEDPLLKDRLYFRINKNDLKLFAPFFTKQD